MTRHGTFTWRRDSSYGWVLRSVRLDQEDVRRSGIGLRSG